MILTISSHDHQVGAISTPTFIIIPMITIWFGIFPIVINWWAALGVTVYGVSTQLVGASAHRTILIT